MSARVDRRVHPSAHLFVGGLLILLGFLFLLDTLGLAHTRQVISRGWPVVLIAMGAVKWTKADSMESRIGAGAWIALGGVFLLSRLGYLPFSVWGLVWPVALIGFGLALVVRSRYGVRVPTDSTSRINAMAFMGGIERKFTSQEFEGGELTAMLGGCQIDFRDADIRGPEAVLEVFVWAGGIELQVPENWTVISSVAPIMAGLEDRTRAPRDSPKRLVIRGFLLMGGIEIKN